MHTRPYSTLSIVNSNGYELMSVTPSTQLVYTNTYPANGKMMLLYNNTNTDYFPTVDFRVEWQCEGTPVVASAEGYDPSDVLTLPPVGMYERHFSKVGPYNWVIPCVGTLRIAVKVGYGFAAYFRFINGNETVFTKDSPYTTSGTYSVDGDFVVHLRGCCATSFDYFFFLSWSCGSHPSLIPSTTSPTAAPTSVPDTNLPAAVTFAPSLVHAMCTADNDCHSGRLDPLATCDAGMCVCHTYGYAHPPGVPLCLRGDDVVVPMGFAVEYGAGARSSWTTTTTTQEAFEENMHDALGTVTEIHVVVSNAGVLVVGMVRASTAKLADALTGKLNLTTALSSEGVSVSHGVTCTSTDATYTAQYNGVCNAVACEGSTTLTLIKGTYTCERETPPPTPEPGTESGRGSNVPLYIGIGVGVLVLGVAVGVVVACCCKQDANEPENPLFKMPLNEDELYPVGQGDATAMLVVR